MPKRSSKPKGENISAFEIIKAATEDQEEPAKEETRQKNPAAVALGRLGGLKGGKARAHGSYRLRSVKTLLGKQQTLDGRIKGEYNLLLSTCFVTLD